MKDSIELPDCEITVAHKFYGNTEIPGKNNT